MPKIKSEGERVELMRKLGLNPKAGEALESPAQQAVRAGFDPPLPVRHEPLRPKAPKVQLAPPGVDPHTMPVSDIVFDPRLLDGFPSLEGMGKRTAADYVFALYKAPGRNKDRNSLLWSRVGKFIDETRRDRETGEGKTTGHTKKKIKASKEQAQVAEVLVSNGIKASHLTDPRVAALLAELAEAEEANK